MFETTYQELHRRQEQAERKINNLTQQKNQAIQKRIKQLNDQLISISKNQNKTNSNIDEKRSSFEQFKRKNKALYKSIYQGAQELDIRKKQFIEDIQRSQQVSQDNY